VPVVRGQNVQKKFGSFTAVAGVNFEIEAGECFGLLGPNGAGKSTLISLLYGASFRSGGDLTVFDLDPQTQGRELKKKLGVVPQDNCLDEAMSVEENMLLFASLVGIARRDRKARVAELLDFMSLSHRKNSRIKELSGGMQRRIAFVRALLSEPQLIILDEPTTGLDPAVRHLLWDKISSLKKDRHSTIILTTHYMDEAERLCDRLLIMDNGKVAASGRPKDLITQHCPGFVAVFEHDKALQDKLETIARGSSAFEFHTDVSGLNLRHPKMEGLIENLRELPSEPRLIRPANLEDVFLKITGKELSANA